MVEVTQERVVQAAVGGRGTICGSLAVVVMGVSREVMKGAISEGKSCAITLFIELRTHVRKRLLRRRLPASRGLESAPGDGGKGGGKVGHVGGSIVGLRLSSCSQNKASTTEPVASSTASSNVNGGRWSANHR